MAGTATLRAATSPVAIRTEPSVWSRLIRNPRVVVGGSILLLLVAVAVFAPLIAPFDPNEQVLQDRLHGPSGAHPMGTDGLGRDMLSRAIFGARVSLSVGMSAMLISIGLGTLIGVASGYFRGTVDNILMRATDVLLSIPVFLLLITVLSIYGSSIPLLMFFLGVTAWPGTARLVRSEVLSLGTREFVTAARVIGLTDRRIMFRHILPNVVPLIAVAATLRVAVVVLAEASLSYFGLGVQPPTATWGNMVADGKGVLDVAWWITSFPGILIVITVLAFNFVGDGLRDVFDPRRRVSGS